jgi:uncharacterized protein YjbI with pentapeptide repeats
MTSQPVQTSSESSASDGATILHMGSVFLSSANVTPDRRVEFRRAFNEAIDIAIQRDVDAVVQAGKLFATRSPTGTDLSNLREQLRRLSDAGITFVNAGSERDADMDEVADLHSEGLLQRPDTEPITVKDTAIYRIPPVDNISELGQLASYVEPAPESAQTVVAAPRTTDPPVENGTFTREKFIEALPFSADAFLLGNARNKYLATHTDTDGPSVIAAGPTELNLRKRLLGKPAEYPCQVGILKPSGKYESISISHNELKVFHVECPVDAEFADIKTRLDCSGADTILVGLRGEYNSSTSVPAEDIEEYLATLTDVYKVWDDRDTVSHSGPTDKSVAVTIQYSSVEHPTAGEAGSDSIPDAVGTDEPPAHPTEKTERTTAETSDEDVGEPTDGDTIDPTTPTTHGDLVDRAQSDESPGVDVEIQSNRGTHVDPTDSYAGAALEDEGFARVEPTSDGSCGYQLDCRRLDRETGQRVTIFTQDGRWKCPHPVHEDGRCVFHHPDADQATIESKLIDCLTGDGGPRQQFIGATFPELDLSNETLGAAATEPIDFRYASFAGELTMTGCVIETPLKLDGAQFQADLDISDAEIRAEISARVAWFTESVIADSSVYHGRIRLLGSLIEGTLRISSATFKDNLDMSQSTIGDELLMTRCECTGQCAGYSLNATGEVHAEQAVFRHDVGFEGARFKRDVNFENARVESFIDFANAEFAPRATFNAKSLRVDNTVYFAGATFGAVNLSGAKIAGPLVYGSTTVNGDFRAVETIFRAGVQLDPEHAEKTDVPPLAVGGELSVVNARFLRDARLAVDVDGKITGRGLFASALLHINGQATQIDLSDGSIDGSLVFELNTDNLVDFAGIDIAGDCRLSDCDIGSDLDVSAGAIDGTVSLIRVSITGELADLRHTTLGDSLRIDNADIPTLQLKDSRLEDAFYSSLATFEKINLTNATVEGRVQWTNPTISEQLLLNDGSFEDIVNIETAIGTDSDPDPELTTGVELEGPIDDQITIGEIEAQNALFKNRVELATVTHKLFIDGIHAAGRIDLGASSIGTLDANEVTIEEAFRCEGATIQDISLVDSDVDTLSCHSLAVETWALTDSSIDTITLEGIERLESQGPSASVIIDAQRARLRGGSIAITEAVYIDLTDATVGPLRFTEVEGGPGGAAFLRHIRFYRTIFDGFRIAELPGLSTHYEIHTFAVDRRDYKYEAPTSAGLTTTYRRAKNGAAAVGDGTAEGKFFEQEKAYLGDQYKADNQQKELLKNRLWRISAGYGESPTRVIFFSGGTILGFAVLYPVVRAVELLLTGQAPGEIFSRLLSGTLLPGNYSTVSGWLLLSAESFTTLVLGKTPVESTFLRILAAIEGFLGAFLIALFLFTLTKSIDR